MSEETLRILGESMTFAVGDIVFWKATAQRKAAVRKAMLAATAIADGSYSVRYWSGGVRIERMPTEEDANAG